MEPERRGRSRWCVWLIAGLLVVGLVAALVAWGRPLFELMADQERIRAWVEGFGWWAPVIIIVLEMAQVLLAPIPGHVVGAVSGYLYGPWLGTLYTMVGLVLGSLLGFLLARRFGRPLMQRLVSPETLNNLDRLADRGGALFFFLLWLFPLVPDDIACLAAGLTPMPVRQFLVLMTIGRLPGVFASVWVGANSGELSPTWLAGLLIGLALLAVVLWRWGERAQATMLHFIQRLTDGSGS